MALYVLVRAVKIGPLGTARDSSRTDFRLLYNVAIEILFSRTYIITGPSGTARYNWRRANKSRRECEINKLCELQELMQVRPYVNVNYGLQTYRLGSEMLAQLTSLTSSPKSNSSPCTEEAVDLVDADMVSKSSSPNALRKSASDAVRLEVWLAAE